MSKSAIINALRAFDEKYLSVRYPAQSITVFGDAMRKYLNDVQNAIGAGKSEEHIKNITNDFLKQQFYSEDDFRINTENNITPMSGNLLRCFTAAISRS